MIRISQNKFFNYYLPLILTAIVLIVSAGIYMNLKNQPKEAEAAWYNSSWSYRKPITIDHTKISTVATSTFTNFPLLISVTDSDLKSTGNGGKQASSTGVDILFTDSNGTTKLDHEVETYASTTGQLIAWVRIPTLTASADYPIYIYFGNSGASDQSNKTGVWDASYSGVWHLPDGTTLSTKDSTAFTNDGTVTGSVTATTGQIYGGASFPGTTNNYIGTPSMNLGTTFTVEGWANPSSIGSNSPRIVENTFQTGFFLGVDSATSKYWFIVNSDFTVLNGSATLNKWAHVVGVYDGSKASLYVNGVLVAGPTTVAAPGVGAHALSIGDVFAHNDNNSAWNGKIDEVRVATVARSADWLATEYNNQNSPSTFYAYGSLGVLTPAAALVAVTSHGSAGAGWYVDNGSFLVVAHTGVAGTGDSATTTAINTTGAVLLIAVVSTLSAPGATLPTDSKGNTWVKANTYGSSAPRETIFYSLNPSSVGSGHTFSYTASGNFPSIAVIAVSANGGTIAFDTETGATGGTPGSITPGHSNEFVITGLSHSDVGTHSVNGGFTLTDQVAFSNSVNYGVAAAYLIQTTAAAANPTWSGTNIGASGIAAFKVTSAPPYSYRKPITIDHTKLSTTATTTFSSFPMLVSVTDSQLKSTGNGGLVTSATGADILFTDSNGATKLDYEIENYASSTGQLIAWVRIPTLTSSADYPIYIYFGNSSASDQSNKTGVWDSNYKGVWHFPNGTTLGLSDSTSNAQTGTNHSATAATGQIYGGAGFSSASSEYIDNGTITGISGATAATLSGWMYRSASSNFVSFGQSTTNFRFNLEWYNDTNLYLQAENGIGSFPFITPPQSTGWHYITFVFDGSQTGFARAKGYWDGALQTLNNGFGTTPPTSLASGANQSAFWVGRGNSFSDGTIDEVRVSNINRSADWIATEYNNQYSPSTFYTYGSLGSNGRQNSSSITQPAVKIRGGVKFR